MEYFAGLDVGLEETSVCLVDDKGKAMHETKVVTDPEALHSALKGYADHLGRVGLEASSLGTWLHRELQAMGFPVVVVEARQMRSSLSSVRNKTDRNDARGIAQMMRLGWFRAVHVKSIDAQRMQTLLANRRLLKRKLIDIENHVRGALRVYGLRVGQVSRSDYDQRIRKLIEGSEAVLGTTIKTMLALCNAVLDGFNELHEMLLGVVKEDKLCRRFMTVPGVGPITALSFQVAIDDPHRFARSRTVGDHLGLTPRRHQSGTSIDIEGHITKQGDINTRGALCEAAASLLLRVRRWSALKDWGIRIAKQSSMMCAIVAVARKLASILHRMWLDGSEFQWSSGAKVTEK